MNLGLPALVKYAFALFVGATMVASPCLAQNKRRAVVLPIEVTSSTSSHLAKTVTASIRRELGRFADLSDQGLIDFSLSEARLSFSCMNEGEECMSAIGETIGVEIMFWGQLTQTNSGLGVRLRGIDVTRKRIVYTLDTSVQDGVALEQHIDDITNAFLSGQPFIQRQETLIKLRSTPPGANVWIDGRSYGPTPVEATVNAGSHRITLEREGYLRIVEDISVQGRTETLRYALERGALMTQPPIVDKAEQPSISFWTGTSFAVIALGSAVAGTVLHVQATELRRKELTEDENYTFEDARLKSQILGAARAMDTELVTSLRTERRNLHSGRSAAWHQNSTEYDEKYLAGNITLGIAGVSAITAVYLLLFHESRPSVAASHDQVTLSFDF